MASKNSLSRTVRGRSATRNCFKASRKAIANSAYCDRERKPRALTSTSPTCGTAATTRSCVACSTSSTVLRLVSSL